MIKPLKEMTVLVTGASGGIGSSIAKRFASVGMKVVIHYVNHLEAANETARSCLSAGSQVLTVRADLRFEEEVLHMKDKLDNHGMMPDILVNNAGITHYGPLAETTVEQWDEVINTNLRSAFLCSKIFMPYMISQKFGRIVNVSSVWGISGASCEVAYSASKGGMNAFTKALAKELAPSGITVNAVAPGAIDTEMMKQFDSAEIDTIQNDIPAGRFGKPDEIASLVYFIALPESGYITGQIISPNGGWLT